MHVTGTVKKRSSKDTTDKKSDVFLQLRAVLHYDNGTTKDRTKNTNLTDTKRNRTNAGGQLNQWKAQLLAEMETEAKAAEELTRLEKDPLFLDALYDWFESKEIGVRENTRYSYELTHKRHYATYPPFQGIRVTEVTACMLNQYFKDKGQEGLCGVTLSKHYANFKQFFSRKEIRATLVVNPINEVDVPKREKVTKDKIFSPEQLNALIKATTGTLLESVVKICAAFGLRRSEVVGLLWDAVDFDNRWITIRRTMQCVGGTNTLTEFTKSKASRRSLSMSTTMFDYLVQLKAEQEENKKKFGSQYDSTGYVCCHADGKPLRAEDITSRFAKTIKELGFEDLSVHSLRHTVATKLARNNLAIAKVQKFLGHESPLTTARYYVHIPQEDSLECADILSPDVFV